jgi:MoaA/NifB/PqqE/SkfB family radical SAM enzyme
MLSPLKQGIKSALSSLYFASGRAFPLRNITLEVTWDCNLSCFMCARHVFKLGRNNLSLEQFKYILGQFPRLKYINIVGLGETLMNPYFFEMLDIAQSRNIKVDLTTNGTLLNENNISRLNSSVSNIYVSVDSPCPEKYEWIRKGAKFEKVVENLNRLKELKPGIRLCIQALIMKENEEDLPQLIDLAKSIKADKVSLIHMISWDEEYARRYPDNPKNTQCYLQKTEELAQRQGIQLTSRPTHPQLVACTEPWFGPYITINGDIYPCSFIRRTPRPIPKEYYLGVPIDVPVFQYKMGNIFEGSFNKIWNGSDYRLLRKLIRQPEKRKRLSSEELNQRRRKVDLAEKFSYCKVCLCRWSCAC